MVEEDVEVLGLDMEEVGLVLEDSDRELGARGRGAGGVRPIRSIADLVKRGWTAGLPSDLGAARVFKAWVADVTESDRMREGLLGSEESSLVGSSSSACLSASASAVSGAVGSSKVKTRLSLAEVLTSCSSKTSASTGSTSSGKSLAIAATASSPKTQSTSFP